MQPVISFPDQLATIPTPVLLDVYDQAASRVTQLITGLSADQLSTRARGPGRWSIGEIISHLADSEIVGAVRFRLLRSDPGADLPVYDQDAFADRFGYRTRDRRDLDTALETFAALRRSTGALLRTWQPADWELTGRHPDWGTLTARQLLELYAEHGERHLDQILDLRSRMGRSTPLASILAHRFNATPVPAPTGGAA